MRAHVQCVTEASVEVDAQRIAERTWHLRVFRDDEGRMNLPVEEVGGEVLVVSQFTLYGDTSRGRRPSWVAAAPPRWPNRCSGRSARHWSISGHGCRPGGSVPIRRCD